MRDSTRHPPLFAQEHWHGNTPLYEAARAGHRQMAEWLVEHGAEPGHAQCTPHAVPLPSAHTADAVHC